MASLWAKLKKIQAYPSLANTRPNSGPVNKSLASTSQNQLATVASAAHFPPNKIKDRKIMLQLD